MQRAATNGSSVRIVLIEGKAACTFLDAYLSQLRVKFALYLVGCNCATGFSQKVLTLKGAVRTATKSLCERVELLLNKPPNKLPNTELLDDDELLEDDEELLEPFNAPFINTWSTP